MRSLEAIWERLNQPLLPGEAQWWVYVVAFVCAVLLPFLLLLLNRMRWRLPFRNENPDS